MFIHNYNIIDNILLTCFHYDLLIRQKSVQLLTELGAMRLIGLYYTVVLLKNAEKSKTCWEKYLSKMKTKT